MAPKDGPLHFHLNHPSWWDPMICLLLPGGHRVLQRSSQAPSAVGDGPWAGRFG